MKKILCIGLFILVLSTIGCFNQYRYPHNNPDLYTEAIYSMLGIRSYFDDYIEIIETDDYGRTLFLFYPRLTDFSYENLTTLFICQQSDREYVYYYQDINFIMIDEYVLSNEIINTFGDETINEFKTINDWNKELNIEQCIKKEITRTKASQQISEEEVLDLVNQNNLIEFEGITTWVCYFDSDIEGKSIFFIQDLERSEIPNYSNLNSYIVLVDNNEINIESGILQINNLYGYQQDLHDFRLLNEWLN